MTTPRRSPRRSAVWPTPAPIRSTICRPAARRCRGCGRRTRRSRPGLPDPPCRSCHPCLPDPPCTLQHPYLPDPPYGSCHPCLPDPPCTLLRRCRPFTGSRSRRPSRRWATDRAGHPPQRAPATSRAHRPSGPASGPLPRRRCAPIRSLRRRPTRPAGPTYRRRRRATHPQRPDLGRLGALPRRPRRRSVTARPPPRRRSGPAPPPHRTRRPSPGRACRRALRRWPWPGCVHRASCSGRMAPRWVRTRSTRSKTSRR